MIFTALLVATALVATEAATTVTMPPMTTTTMSMTTQMAAKILYDTKHHKAMIVRADGCYEYHLNHNDAVGSPELEARMLQELSMMTSKSEMGHNHINHMTQEIVTACASLPVYSFSI